MQALYEQVVTCIKKDPCQRSNEEVEYLCNWFVQKSNLFSTIKADAVKDIIRNCEFIEVQRDNIIIKQGEKGDCFFVILSGRVSVYINTDAVPDDPEDPTEEVPPAGVGDPPPDRTVSAKGRSGGKTAGKAVGGSGAAAAAAKSIELDRSKYGQHILTLESGKSFGELALINKDCIRNASIIADEAVHLLMVSRELYNRSLRAAQEAEFKARTDFVSQCPLFSNWQPKYKRQAAMSLRKERLHFGMDIVRQGDPVNGLIFIIKGQAKIVINVPMHYNQYPSLKLHEVSMGDGNTTDKKEFIGEIIEQNFDFREESKKQLFAKPRRRQGYSLAEHRRALKHLEVSLVGDGEIIGDVEKSFDLSTYMQSYISTVTSDVYFLDEKNYERLISTKRNFKTLLAIRDEAELKVLTRVSRSLDKQVPLIQLLVRRIMDKIQKQEDARATESGEILVSCLQGHHSHLMNPSSTGGCCPGNSDYRDRREPSFIPPRGAIIDLYGPGTVFFRNRMKRMATWRANGGNAGDVGSGDNRGRNSRRNNNSDGNGETMFYANGIDDEMGDWEGEGGLRGGIGGSETDDVANFIDWETSGDHLSSLEDRLKSWFSNMEAGGAGPGAKGPNDNVVKLRRYIKKDDGQVIHPGKTILLRPKKTQSTGHTIHPSIGGGSGPGSFMTGATAEETQEKRGTGGLPKWVISMDIRV